MVKGGAGIKFTIKTMIKPYVVKNDSHSLLQISTKAIANKAIVRLLSALAICYVCSCNYFAVVYMQLYFGPENYKNKKASKAYRSIMTE